MEQPPCWCSSSGLALAHAVLRDRELVGSRHLSLTGPDVLESNGGPAGTTTPAKTPSTTTTSAACRVSTRTKTKVESAASAGRVTAGRSRTQFHQPLRMSRRNFGETRRAREISEDGRVAFGKPGLIFGVSYGPETVLTPSGASRPSTARAKFLSFRMALMSHSGPTQKAVDLH